MTETQAPRTRKRALKTWSAFGNLGRRPTEYEILTHNMNHTVGGLEMGPEVHGNVWLREHRDTIALTEVDWDAFRDPDAMTYGTYVAGQDDQETYVEGLLEQFDAEDYDAALSDEARGLLFRALTPSRYVAHCEQMLSAYLQQLAISSYVGNCAAFQTADQLRRVQLTAYRTVQLRQASGHEDTQADRRHWEGGEGWQPVRRAMELALVEFDWDRAFVATNLVAKPMADIVFLDQLASQLVAVGAQLDSLVLENLWRDAQRSQRWTVALARFVVEQNPANQAVLQGYLDDLAPLADGIATSGGSVLATPAGAGADAIADAARRQWAELVSSAGLQAPVGS